MNRYLRIQTIREKLSNSNPSIGSWIQIPNSSLAEIMGNSGYDWVAVDLEHGSIDKSQLPDLFRALELGETLPLVRLSGGSHEECKGALDAGAGGVIVPNITSGSELKSIREACCWPPTGHRGVGFSRANLFGSNFEAYAFEAQNPLLIGMIESAEAVSNIYEIMSIEGLDALFIGPYDLSASLGIMGQFSNPLFVNSIAAIKKAGEELSVPIGIHVVSPSQDELNKRIAEGYTFIAYSIDSVFLNISAKNPFYNNP